MRWVWRRWPPCCIRGGTATRCSNYHVLDEPVVASFEALYREHAPDAQPHARPPDNSDYLDPFAGNEAFCSIEQRTYYWERPLSATNGWDRQRLFSDHQRLGLGFSALFCGRWARPSKLWCGIVQAQGGTYVVLARHS